MPIKQRAHKARAHQITTEALDAFAADDWTGLRRALRLKPWEPSPLDTVEELPPADIGPAWPEAWAKVYALRLEILERIRDAGSRPANRGGAR